MSEIIPNPTEPITSIETIPISVTPDTVPVENPTTTDSAPAETVPNTTISLPSDSDIYGKGEPTGDVICSVDGDRYAIDPNVVIPENCADEPVNVHNTVATVGESRDLPRLPATGPEIEAMGAIGLAALVTGAVLVGLSRRPNHRLQ